MSTVPETTGTARAVAPSASARAMADVARLVERALVWPVTVAGCTLLLAITLLLLAGVASRFVFDAPLTWVDELVSILFLWLAVLGATLAFQRLEHMRMTALVDRLSPRGQRLAATVSLVACLLLLGALLLPAVEYAADEAFMTTPSLELPGSWRAAALPTGIGLMLAFSVLQLARLHLGRDLACALLVCAAVGGGLYLSGPWLVALGNVRLLVFFVGLVGVCIALGIPIAFSFATATFSFLATTTSVPLTVVVNRIDEGMSHILLLAVPLFVLLGVLIEVTGMAKAMIDFLASLVGHLRGGLQYVLMVGMYLVSGISGSKAADMAAIAPPLIPQMRARGADPGNLVALLAATGAQTETVPPSIVLITIGSVTGVSIAALFTGGILPSLLMGCLLAAVVWWRNRGATDTGQRPLPAGWGQRGRALLVALPALVLPFIIRSAVVKGLTTATEVSTIGLLYAVVYALFARALGGWRTNMGAVLRGLVDTTALTGAILLIVGCASAMAWALTQSGFSRQLGALMHAVPGGAYGFLAVSVFAFLVLGSVLEGLPAVVLLAPIVWPIARSFAISEVHYAIVIVLAMGIGLFAPPFGVGYYTACAIAKVETSAGLRPIVAYMVALVIGLAVVAAVPWLTTALLPAG